MPNLAVSASDIADTDAVRIEKPADDDRDYLLKASNYADGPLHVELEDAWDYAESCGTYLADIALTIIHDHAAFETSRKDKDLLAAIVDGFNEGLRNNGHGMVQCICCGKAMRLPGINQDEEK